MAVSYLQGIKFNQSFSRLSNALLPISRTSTVGIFLPVKQRGGWAGWSCKNWPFSHCRERPCSCCCRYLLMGTRSPSSSFTELSWSMWHACLSWRSVSVDSGRLNQLRRQEFLIEKSLFSFLQTFAFTASLAVVAYRIMSKGREEESMNLLMKNMGHHMTTHIKNNTSEAVHNIHWMGLLHQAHLLLLLHCEALLYESSPMVLIFSKRTVGNHFSLVMSGNWCRFTTTHTPTPTPTPSPMRGSLPDFSWWYDHATMFNTGIMRFTRKKSSLVGKAPGCWGS